MSSSSSSIDTLRFAAQQVNIYLGLFICITGIFGGLLNIIVFTTLRTFRETTCGIYLTAASIYNLGQSLSVVFRVFNTGFGYGPFSSPIFCKFRFFAAQYFGLVSLTSMCMATIDQFLSMTKYRNLNSLSLARRHVIFTCIFWFIHGIFTFIYYSSNGTACILTNSIFAKYYTYFYLPILVGFLPTTITSLFSILAYYQTFTVIGRQIDIIRFTRDRQLTAMTLVHAFFLVITTIPFVVCFVYTLSTVPSNPEEAARIQLIYTITSILDFEGFAVSFLRHSEC
jgi:hypothetical protein